MRIQSMVHFFIFRSRDIQSSNNFENIGIVWPAEKLLHLQEILNHPKMLKFGVICGELSLRSCLLLVLRSEKK